MKRQIILLVITLLIALSTICQPLNKDTVICLPTEQLKLAIVKIETAKVIKEELAQTNIILNFKNQLLLNKDSIINVYSNNEIRYTNVINNYKKANEFNKSIISNNYAELNYKDVVIKRQKKHKILFGIIGIVIGFLIFKN